MGVQSLRMCSKLQDTPNSVAITEIRPFFARSIKMANRITAPELEQFIVATVELTGRALGAGAYGSVEEVEIPGATVAAKKLHQQLVNLGSPQQVDLFLILAPLLIFLVSIDYIYWLISPHRLRNG